MDAYMHSDRPLREALAMLQDGASDEEVERMTGLDLLSIVEMRALKAAGAPYVFREDRGLSTPGRRRLGSSLAASWPDALRVKP